MMLRELVESEILEVQGGSFCAGVGSSHVLVYDVGCGGTGGGWGYRSTFITPGGGANDEDLRQMTERIFVNGSSTASTSSSTYGFTGESERLSKIAGLYGKGREMFTTRTNPYPGQPGIWD